MEDPAARPAAHLANLDLNLLVALRELLRERNVTRAAARIGVTQPAASAALSRLRRHFDDELLVRRAGSYALSPLAAQLADQVEAVCAAAERLFATGRAFDPARSRREFTLVTADYTIGVLGARLSAALAARAPGVRLHLQLVREAFTADVADTIRLLDGVVAPPAARLDRPGMRSLPLFTDRWVVVVDRDHPTAGGGLLTAAALGELPWVVAFQPDRGLDTAAPLHGPLRQLGIQPEVRVRVEGYEAVPRLVAGTDRVALVQERLATAVAGPLGLRVLDCPGDPLPIEERLWWHADLDGDPAHRWFRELVAEVAAVL
ncbi:LysR substrate-binding domain-containing protein [Modestobacter sp. NPDC049651]|uniref:LysR family transcriptional regulator n=1 Tax=unclassified Modestobacter TaxID=2643866 RepID=UPI0033C9A147